MPQETKSDGSIATHQASPAGWKADLADPAMTLDALEKAFDYRGDVTLNLRNGGVVSGYIFDRSKGQTLADSHVRILPSDGSARQTVGYDQIAQIAFSDRDPAAGKSFDTWVKRYVEKKLAGEQANIESEVLE